MAFNYLPNEIKEKILLHASEYSPALKMVCSLWREIISYSGVNKRISFKDLVRRGDVDLLIDLHKRKKKDDNCSLLIYAAFYGREELCHLAKRWGESNFEGMLYAATKGGHKNICQIARRWGAKGIDDLYSDLVVQASCEDLCPLSFFWRDSILVRMSRDGKHKDLQPIVKEWELNNEIIVFSEQDDPKTGNTYITVNKWAGMREWRKTRMTNSKPKDLWSDGGTIVSIY